LSDGGDLSDLYFDDIISVMVKVSEQVSETHATEPANRTLFEALNKADFDSSKRTSDEQLEVAYVDLYRYVPELQSLFDQTIEKIKVAETKSHTHLAQSLQDKLFDPALLKLQRTPAIGNPLREEVSAERTRLHKEIEDITLSLRTKMLTLIQLPDEDLQDPTRRSAAVKIIIGSDTQPTAR
jgi:hypothetical protein